MKGIRKIWAISSGSYSDYTVHAVTEDKATAEMWMKALRAEEDGCNGDATVEEILLVESGVAPFKATSWNLSVDLWDDGREDELCVRGTSTYPIAMWGDPPPPRPRVRKVRAPIHRDKGGRLEVFGATEKAVRKVGNEQILMWRARVDKRMFWGKSPCP